MYRRILSAFLVVCVLAITYRAVDAQTSDSQYFNETGHSVSGEFLDFYNKVSNPLLMYGYPITERFISKDGKDVQYFQRARFEYHLELPAGQQILLTPLGAETYRAENPINIFSPFACRYFESTNNSVCFAFLEFFDNQGGVQQFGLPISPFEYHDGMLVQYFERTRLEWHPWNPNNQLVSVGDLGRIYFELIGEDPARLAAAQPLDANIQALVLSVHVRAFTQNSIMPSAGNQTVFIITQDQHGTAIEKADCSLITTWPDGHAEIGAVQTNANGIGSISFSFKDQPHGSLIFIGVTCRYLNVEGKTTSSFRIWQ